MILFIGYKNKETMSLIGCSNKDESDVVRKTGASSFQQILNRLSRTYPTKKKGRQVDFKNGSFVRAIDF